MATTKKIIHRKKSKKKIQKESFLQEDLQVYMEKILQDVQKEFLNLEYLYLEYAMECNL